MRVIFMGTPDFSVPALEAVHAEHDVVCVYTSPRAPQAVARNPDQHLCRPAPRHWGWRCATPPA
jgi:methionyl-tRNA formyltransferase